MPCSSFLSKFASLLIGLAAVGFTLPAAAADPEFVGTVALALEKDVARQLELSAEQQQKLLALVERRESEVLDLVLNLRGAPPAEREAKLAPFRAASEAEGLKLFDAKQRSLLEQIRVRRAGGASFTEPAVAARLKLSPEQQTAVAKLLAERADQLAQASGQNREVLRNAFEQRLFAVLEPEQRTAWEQAAGTSTAEAAKVTSTTRPGAATTASVSQSPTASTAGETKPAAEGTPGKSGTEASTVAAKPINPDNIKLKFNFRFQPWEDVLHWFADQAGLSLLMDSVPPGTLNYTDNRSYTPAEALDLMNGVLLTKGYTLIRRERMLLVVNLEDGIPPNLVSFVPAEKLDSLGEYELVTTLFRIEGITPEDAEAELRRLIGPQGAVVVLPKARQVQVTETAGRLRLMRSVLQASAGLVQTQAGDIRAFQPVHVGVEDALPLLRQLLNIPPDAYSDQENSIRLAVDPLSGKLLIGGKPERVAQATEIMKAIDVPAPEAAAGTIETAQLEVYDVGAADAASVLAVLQTLMANYADVRLTTDPITGKLVALAKPTQHATIRAVLEQMQREAQQIEVIRLQFVDPQQAVIAIGRLFGGTGDKALAGAPKVEADPATRQLIVRGSAAQIEQIRSLLSKMGENVEDGAGATADTTTVRMLPLGSRTVRQALEQMEAVWPTLRANRIRVVSPSSGIQSIHPAHEPGSPRGGAAEQGRPMPPLPFGPTQTPPASPGRNPTDGAPQAPPPAASPAAAPTSANPPAANPAPPPDKSTSNPIRVRTVTLRQVSESQANGPVANPADSTGKAPAAATNPPAGKNALPAEQSAAGEPAPIIVAPGPAGVMIASDDVEALNEFENLLNSLASRAMTGGKEFTVFYLENAGAAAAAETLEAVFGAGGGGGGGSLLGDLAGMAMGNMGGNMMSAMLGGGSGGPAASITGSTSVLIVPDTRLNALIVQASPADLDLMEQLLRVIDRVDVPESTVNPRPRLIPVRNTNATQLADIIREIYQDRLSSANRNRQPSPEEFIQMLRGGAGGRGGSGGSSRRNPAEAQKFSISVDSRTNSLVVSAAEPLFQEIQLLVQTLDHATSETNQAIRVVTLKRSNPTTLQKALTAIVGPKVSTNKPSDTPSSATAGTPTGGTPGASSSGGGQPSFTPDARQMQDLMRQRMEMFNQMRGSSGGGFPGGGFPGGGSRDGGRGGDGGRDRGGDSGRDRR
jgi:type II secretory pathway component GspD/PulD (secretin)